MSTLPTELPLFLLKTVVLFPRAALPLRVFEPRYKQMVRRCLGTPLPAFGAVLIEEGPEVEDDRPNLTVTALPHSVGTVARIVGVDHRSDGTINLNVVGGERFHIEEIVQPGPFLVARVTYLEELPGGDEGELSHLADQAWGLGRDCLRRIVDALPGPQPQAEDLLQRIWEQAPSDDHSALSFYLGSMLPAAPRDSQRWLRAETTAARLRDQIRVLRREKMVLDASAQYRNRPGGPRLN